MRCYRGRYRARRRIGQRDVNGAAGADRLVRLLLLARIVGAGLTSLAAAGTTDPHGTRYGVFASLTVSLIALWYWRRAAPLLQAHPLLMGIDVLLSIGVLSSAGPASPFSLVPLATALLIGFLYDWRGQALFSVLLVLGYWYGLSLLGTNPHVLTFQLAVGTPVLFPLAAIGGSALRGVLVRAARADAALQRSVQQAAAAEERARLARELHDSVTKTLHGIALSASALVDWCQRDPGMVPARARDLAAAAEVGAKEARALIEGMRNDLGDGPLELALGGITERFAVQSGLAVRTSCEAGLHPDPTPRYELLQVLAEALANVAKHAQATSVQVGLRRSTDGYGDWAELTVADDGCGFDVGRHVDDWRRAGHYGLLGIAERVARVGGSIRCERGTTRGTTLIAAVPLGPADAAGLGAWPEFNAPAETGELIVAGGLSGSGKSSEAAVARTTAPQPTPSQTTGTGLLARARWGS